MIGVQEPSSVFDQTISTITSTTLWPAGMSTPDTKLTPGNKVPKVLALLTVGPL